MKRCGDGDGPLVELQLVLYHLVKDINSDTNLGILNSLGFSLIHVDEDYLRERSMNNPSSNNHYLQTLHIIILLRQLSFPNLYI